jgi:hypothetical protein
MTGSWTRATASSRGGPVPARSSVAGLAAAVNAPRVAAPQPVLRSPALAQVVLHHAPQRSASGLDLHAIRMAPGAPRAARDALNAATAAMSQDGITLQPGMVQVFRVRDGNITAAKAARLHLDGDQDVRLVCLAQYGRPILDSLLAGGARDVVLPAGTTRVLLWGLGRNGQAALSGAGADLNSVLVYADERTYAGHECLLTIRKGRLPRRPLPTVNGHDVLADAGEVHTTFFRPHGTLAIVLIPPAGTSVRELDAPHGASISSPGLRLPAPIPVVRTSQAALLFDLSSAAPLRVDIAPAAGWRLQAVALLDGTAAIQATRLAAHSRWNLIDPSLGLAQGSSRIRLEVAR